MEVDNPYVREAMPYIKIDDKVKCNTCERFCELSPNDLGFCNTRRNIDRKIYTLEFGDISSSNANPIEKKPFFSI